MNNYWEERYKAGGNSGAGSYGEYAKHKAEVINNYIEKYQIKTISDFGCGDGNQISLFDGYNEYFGYDVASYALFLCQQKFINNPKMHFCSLMSDLPEADLCLSLDVIYHIVNDNDYENYMNVLFNKSKRFVLIFSSNFSDNKIIGNYIFHRKFTDWIEKNHKNFKLVEEIDNFLQTSAKFFLYEKIN